MNPASNCYSLPYNSSFLHVLAEFVVKSYDIAKYPEILILLPNRRSCIALRDAFLDVTGGKPIILPKIQPIGEIEEEAFLPEIAGADAAGGQPIDKVRRHFLLMKLIMTHQKVQAKQGAELARQLASLLDEVNREGLGFEGLAKLAPEELQQHWQQTLDFLNIIAREWPRVLDDEGMVDIVTHRNQLLLALAKLWEKALPSYPVIAAGSTGSQNATAELLKVIAGMPNGKVLLPYLDRGMARGEWEVITETHPQFGLKRLLERMGVEREKVEYLFEDSSPHPNPLPEGEGILKEAYIRAVFSPPAVTANWAKIPLPDARVLDSIKLLEADTLLDEARAIAIAMRGALENAGSTVALVTPDRVLARMVSAQLKRFDIIVDDSAGKPLSASPPACFLRLVLEMVASRAAPASLLALMRHPLMMGGVSAAECRRLSRELEIFILRGLRREGGLAGVRKAAQEHKHVSPELVEFLMWLEKYIEPLAQLFAPHFNAPLSQLLAAHVSLAEELAGSENLWAGEAGNQLAEVIAQWNLQSGILLPIDALTYPALFDSLLGRETYRAQGGLHPRLHILGPIEARLQRYDLVILGSLNEGTWPQSEQADPWMSRPQRAAFGLPSRERAIGQSAHDLVMQLSAPHVLLTRARKVEGAPTIASRWWVRLATLLGGREPEFFRSMQVEDYFAAAQEILEKPADILPITAPAPVPPIDARPREMRVTGIDAWLRDPYSVYASYILDLKKLKELDREPDAADFGNIVHKALEIFTREYPRELPGDIDLQAKLLEAGKKAFSDFMDRPAVACLWWPRFVSMAGWYLNEEKARREELSEVFSEVNGCLQFMVDGKEFTITTRIDRIEQLKAGGYSLVDYKTGTVPSKRDRESGLSNQLPLEALILQQGELNKNIVAGQVVKMEYWKLSGNEIKCEISQIEVDTQKTQEMLEGLVRKFDDAHTPYAASTDNSRYNDYEHLARKKEWELV